MKRRRIKYTNKIKYSKTTSTHMFLIFLNFEIQEFLNFGFQIKSLVSDYIYLWCQIISFSGFRLDVSLDSKHVYQSLVSDYIYLW